VGIDNASGSSVATSSHLFITKTRSGNLIAGIQDRVTPVIAAYLSTNGGSTWSSINHPWENANSDRALGVHCNTGDDDDGAILLWDASTHRIDVKTYDASANSWLSSTYLDQSF